MTPMGLMGTWFRKVAIYPRDRMSRMLLSEASGMTDVLRNHS